MKDQAKSEDQAKGEDQAKSEGLVNAYRRRKWTVMPANKMLAAAAIGPYQLDTGTGGAGGRSEPALSEIVERVDFAIEATAILGGVGSLFESSVTYRDV